ncbi:MAG TPA: glycosyltransferase family 9 protein [Candidatus Methylacidiphilales bacterium]|nr:glycosyltransferase family 9 protein [Candidatus Methylacidiphilales bacterium]
MKNGASLRQRLKRMAWSLVPDSLYRRAAAAWHLRGRGAWVRQVTRERGKPGAFFHFGNSPGDDLLCTAVLREWRRRGGSDVWMMSNFPALFENNPDVDHVVPVHSDYWDYALISGLPFRRLRYVEENAAGNGHVPPARHIIAELCACAGIRGKVALRPHLALTQEEKSRAQWAGPLIAIQSTGLSARVPMLNKQWPVDRFQQVVDALRGSLSFVQLGSPADPPLQGVRDLRGKTGIRETAAVLANCRLFVGNVGFLMHLARAVECPSVIVFGGREAPWQSGYPCNANLYSDVACAPCWLFNDCDYQRKCLAMIGAEQVVAAVQRLHAQPRNPLPADEAEI